MHAALAAFALLAMGCSEERGSVSGSIHLGDAPSGHGVIVQLYRFQPGAGDGPNTLRLFSSQFLGLTGESEEFEYTFSHLDPGGWVVGAFVDLDDDGRPGVCEPQTINEFHRITIAANGTLHHEQDVYVLRSGPGTVTLTGNLHLGPRARERPTSLALLTGPIQKAGSQIRAILPVCGTGDTRPFTLHNAPEGRFDLVAFAHPVRDEDFSLYGLLATNPLRLDAQASPLVDNLSLWIDAQSPELGSISGTLTFNAPVGEAVVQVMAFDRDPSDPEARATALELLRPDPDSASVPFILPSLALRTHHIAAALEVVDHDGTVQATSRLYTHTRTEPGVPLSSAARHADISLSLGLGRVSGDIKLSNAPAHLRSVFVMATVQSDDGIVVEVFDEYPGSVTDGAFTTPRPYTLFGLEDGTFEMAIVPDVSGDGWLQDELNSNYIFGSDPPKVTVVGGGRVGADFRVRLP